MGLFDMLQSSALRADVSWDSLDGDVIGRGEGWTTLGGGQTFADFPMNPDRAMRVSTVFACNSLIAEILASMPCVLYERTDDEGNKRRAREHRVYRTLRHAPNAWMSPMDFFGNEQMRLGLGGDAFAEIVDDGTRMELRPMLPERMVVEQLSSSRLRYQYTDPFTHQQRTLLQDEVLHVRDLSRNGIVGLSRAALAREAIAVAAAGEAYVGGFFANDATGRLLITHPSPLNPEKRGEFREMIQENYAGWRRRSKAMVLTHGVTATELGKHDDSGFIVDPRKFQVTDVARYWRVPLFLIGLEEKSSSWGSGVDVQTQGFITFTIKSWADRWAQAMERCLLTDEERDRYFIEFTFEDLLRGDVLKRAQTFAIFRGIGVYSANDVRRKINENARPGGDSYQENMTGAAPNAGVDMTGANNAGDTPPAPPSDGGTDEQAEIVVPTPLLTDLGARLAARERRDLGTHLEGKPRDPKKFAAWAHAYFTREAAYAMRQVEPLVQSFAPGSEVADWFGERVARTGIHGLDEGRVPAGWQERRAGELAQILDECFRSADALRRAALQGAAQ